MCPRTDLTELPVHERTIVLVWNAKGVIDNGGFTYFFEQRLPVEDTASAFEAIGEPTVADLVRRAVLCPPDRDAIQELDRKFWAIDDRVEKLLAQFIRQNRKGFP